MMSVWPLSACANTRDELTTYDQSLRRADSLYRGMQFRNAYDLYLRLLDDKEAQADSEKRLYVLNSLCNASELAGHKTDQTKWIQQLLDLARQTGNDYYPDGLTEAVNADDEMLGHERVLSEANRAIQAGKTAPGDLVERMRQTVRDFAGGTEQSDDLTLLAIQFEHPKK